MNLETKDIIKEEIEHKIKSCSNEIQDYLEIELNKSKETFFNQWLEIERLNNIIKKAIHFINLNQDEKRLTLNYNDLKILRGILNNDEYYLRLFEEQLNELKENK